jgi:cell division septation protein DedD
MRPNHPNLQPEEPAISPALSRRRDHMLHGDTAREPRLLPPDVAETESMRDPEAPPEEEFDPEIPPLPSAAASEFEEDSDEPSAAFSDRRSRLWPIMAAAVSVAALGAVTWVVYAAVMETGGSEVPYITAEAGPEKIRPQNAGGMEVPNQDIRVYDELSGAPPSRETEVLLPVPEAPIAPPVAAEPSPPASEAAEIPRVAAPAPDVEPAAGSGAQTADAAPSTSAPDEPEIATAEAPSPEPEPPTQTAAAAGAFRIQLVAVKSQDAAESAWKKMTKAHPDILAGLTLKVVKVDRGAEGAIYRVQGGPLADRTAAETACGKLKQKRQDCLVVAP